MAVTNYRFLGCFIMQGVFLFYFTGVVIYKNNVFCETDGPYIPRKKKRSRSMIFKYFTKLSAGDCFTLKHV